MKLSLFDYALDESLVALQPPEARDGGRLLVLGANRGNPDHRLVADLPALITPGSCLVLNDTRVIPARLIGHKVGSGGKAEVFLLRPVASTQELLAAGADPLLLAQFPAPGALWLAMGRASKGLREGACIQLDKCKVHIVAHTAGNRTFVVAIEAEGAEQAAAAIERVGQMPLPPYLRREAQLADKTRYQTVFAHPAGAVAAPTAGLHLTAALLAQLAANGVEIVKITLHVGLGTFQSVTAEDLDDHPMHEEVYEISASAAAAVAAAKRASRPVVAVGTTVVRALESAIAAQTGELHAASGATSLLIQPGYEFRLIDRLITNFHLPKSTLLALVAAFSGRHAILDAYATATAARYRFFSYGDAMLLDRNPAPGSNLNPESGLST